jgi:general secretion pathway protein A
MDIDHYGLTGRPFQLTPDPRFYFDSATHRKAMAYLGYGLAQGEGFIVVTGEIGAGKTTLVGHLMACVDPARVNAVKIVTTALDGDDMLRMVAQALGIAVDGGDKAHLLGRIEAYLNDRSRAGQRTLLIVDEVQNLPVASLEELRMLSNFQAGGQALLQIFLLGQPEFRDTVNSPELEQLRQRVIATHHLMPMEAEEVGPYIVHRMRMVGWQGQPDFTADAFAALYAHTGGVPRLVNMLASRVLLLGAVEQAQQIDRRVVDAAFADLQADTGTPSLPQAPAYQAPHPVAAPQPAYVEVSPVMPPPTPEPTPVTVAVVEVEPEHAPEPAHVVVQPDAHRVPEPATEKAAPINTSFDQNIRALDIAARVAMLEAQVEEQDAALRRILTLLVDWVEVDNGVSHQNGYARAPAA